MDRIQHLRDHNIEPEEAEDCFFHDYDLASDDRRFEVVYILDGRIDRGTRLRLVFQDKGNRLAHVFTGWESKPNQKETDEKAICRAIEKREREKESSRNITV